MAEPKQYDDYTLPDGKVVRFDADTPDDIVQKHLLENYSDSLNVAPRPPDEGSRFSDQPGAFARGIQAFQAGFEKGTGQIVPGIKAGVAIAAGDEESFESAQADMARVAEEAAENNPDPSSFAEAQDKFAEEGIISGAGEIIDFAAQSIGQSLGVMAPSIAMLGAGAFAAPTTAVALVGAGTATRFAQYFAETTERAYHNGEASIEDQNLLGLLASAGGQVSLESLSLGAAGVLGPALRAGSPLIRNAANRAVAVEVQNKLVATYGSTAARFATATAVEAGTETGQLALERAAAGESITPQEEEDMHEYIENLAGAILGSTPFSGFAAQQHYSAPKKQLKQATKLREAAQTRVDAANKAKEKAQAVKEEAQLRHSTRVKKISDELVEEAKTGSAARITESTRVAERDLSGLRETNRTFTDIQEVALDRGIDIDSSLAARAGFQRIVFDTIGTHNIEQATPDQTDQVYARIASFKQAEDGQVRPIPTATMEESVTLAEKIASQRTQDALSRADLRKRIKSLIAKEGRFFADPRHLDVRTTAIIKKMLDHGLLIESKIGRKATYTADVDSIKYLAQDDVRDAANALVEAAASSVRVGKTPSGGEFEVVGEFPTLAEVRGLLGATLQKAEYTKIVAALEKRGIIGKRNGKGRFFHKDIPDILSTRREFAPGKKAVRKHIVRTPNGDVAHIGNTKKDAADFVKANPSETFLDPSPESGFIVRESEFFDEDGKQPRLLRSMPVEFVRDEPGAEYFAQERADDLADLNNKQRKEFLGNEGDRVKSDLDPEIARLARSESETDRAQAKALLKKSPYRESRVIDRYNYGIEEDSVARNDVTVSEKRMALPFDLFSQFGPSVRVVVKQGILTDDNKGFGIARIQGRFPEWQTQLTNVMERITREGADAFTDTSNLQRFAVEDGRTIVVDGVGDTAQYYVFDYVEEGSLPKFHLYNMFVGDENYSENVEDVGPLRGFAEHRGQGVTPQSVLAAMNPDHKSVKRHSPAQRIADDVALNVGYNQQLSSGNVNIGPPPPPKGLAGFVNDFVNKYWGDNAAERFRIKTVDRMARPESREALVADSEGNPLGEELSAMAMIRLYDRMPHMMWSTMTTGYIKYRKILNKDGSDEGGGVFDPTPYEMAIAAPEMPIYNPNTKEWETADFNSDIFSDSKENTEGGILTVLTALEPDRLKKAIMYMRGRRAHNITEKMAIEQPGVRPEVPMSPKEIRNAMSLTEHDGDIAVAVKNLDTLNGHLVDMLVDSGVLSEEDRATWMQNNDYISFYKDMEGWGNESITARMKKEREQNNIPKHFLGDLGYKLASKEYKGFKKQKWQTVDDALQEPISSMFNNQLAALMAAVGQQSRQRAIRNEVTLGAARLYDPETSAEDVTPVKVRIKGKDVLFEMDDELMYHTLESNWGNAILDRLQMHPYLKWVSTTPAQLLRETVTRNPGFALPNQIRDATVVAAMNGGGMKFVADAFRRTAFNINEDRKGRKGVHKNAKLLSQHGVATGIDMASSVNNEQDMIKRAKRQIDTGSMHRFGVVGDAWRAAGRYSAYSESATRELVYENAYNLRMEKLQADGRYKKEDHAVIARTTGLHQAKEILNFNTRGDSEILRLITTLSPFINARIQGMDVLARGAFKFRRVGYNSSVTPDQMQTGLMRRAAYIAGVSSLIQLMLIDDEDYEGEQGYKRDENWYIPIPGTQHSYITIPTPFEFGFLTKTVPEQIVRMVYRAANGETDRAARDSVRSAKAFMSGTLAPGQAIPVVLRPLVEWATNETIHGDVPIESYWEKNLPAEARIGPKTTAQARAIGQVTGRAIGFGPKRVDAMVRSLTGGLGAHMWASVDTLLRMPAGFVEDWPVPVKPNPRMSDLVVLRRILATGDQTGALQEAYEYRDELERAWSLINNAGTPKEKARLRYKYREEMVARNALKGTFTAINTIRKQENQIRENQGKLGSGEMARKLADLAERKRQVVSQVRGVRKRFDQRN